jgi:hypothetical protein
MSMRRHPHRAVLAGLGRGDDLPALRPSARRSKSAALRASPFEAASSMANPQTEALPPRDGSEPYPRGKSLCVHGLAGQTEGFA